MKTFILLSVLFSVQSFASGIGRGEYPVAGVYVPREGACVYTVVRDSPTVVKLGLSTNCGDPEDQLRTYRWDDKEAVFFRPLESLYVNANFVRRCALPTVPAGTVQAFPCWSGYYQDQSLLIRVGDIIDRKELLVPLRPNLFVHKRYSFVVSRGSETFTLDGTTDEFGLSLKVQ